MKHKGYLFDLNGTMINDMHYHVRAWHRILNELGSDISPEQTKQECYGKNGELLERIFPGRFSEEDKYRIGMEKEGQYQHDFRPYLQLIAGLDEVLKSSRAKGIKMGIGSAAILYNIDFVLDGTGIRPYIDAIVSADDVVESKPHPETFLACAASLGIRPSECLVFEDAPKGVECAKNAGMDCVVITTMHRPDEFSQYPNVLSFIEDYTGFDDGVYLP